MAAQISHDDQLDGMQVEAAVLRELFLFPHPLTLQELVRHFKAFTTASVEQAERDAVNRAVRELVAAGLVNHTIDDLVLPTRAAHKFAALAEFP